MSREPKMENALQVEGYEFSYAPSIALKHIRPPANPARLARVYEKKRVEDYAEWMKEGDEFPALIVYDYGPGDYELVDGVHRFEAAKLAGFDTFDAIVVTLPADDLKKDQLYYLPNAIGGKGTDAEDRLQQAWALYEGYPESIADICKSLKVAPRRFEAYKKRQEVEHRLIESGYAPLDPVSSERLIANRLMAILYQIKNDNHLRQCYDILATHPKTRGKEIDDFLVEIRDFEGTERQGLDRIEAFNFRLGAPTDTPKTRGKKGISKWRQAIGLIKKTPLAECGLDRETDYGVLKGLAVDMEWLAKEMANGARKCRTRLHKLAQRS